MGLGMMGLAILIFIMVFGMLYVAFRNQEDKANANENVVAGDSVTLIDYTEEDPALHLPDNITACGNDVFRQSCALHYADKDSQTAHSLGKAGYSFRLAFNAPLSSISPMFSLYHPRLRSGNTTSSCQIMGILCKPFMLPINAQTRRSVSAFSFVPNTIASRVTKI